MAFTAVLEADLRALSSEARRRYPLVKDAAEHAILKLRSTSDPSQLAKSDDIVRTFLLACEPKNVKMSSLGLACMQKLISHDAVSPSALSSILATLKDHSEMSEEVIQLKTLQTILTILQSQLHPKDEESMAILLEICLTLLANNRSADSVHGTAAATLRQAVALIFDRVIGAEKLPVLNSGWRSRSARSNSVSGDVSRNMVAAKAVEKALTDDPHIVNSKDELTQAGKLGLKLFEDLTSLAGGGPATWLHVSCLQKNFALDILEYVLSHYVPIFRKLAPYEQVLRDQVCSLLMTSMRTSSELETGDSDPAYRRLVLRTMASVTRLYSSIVTTECEVFLSMLVKSADLELPLWNRIMVVEVLRGFCVEARMLRLLFQTFDMQPKNANLVTDMVKALAKVVSTLQVQEVSEESVALNAAVAGMFNSKAKGVEWAMEHDATGAAVIVASEAHAITLAVEGLLGVVFTVATLTDEAMEAGELNSPRFEAAGSQSSGSSSESHKDGGELASTCLVLVSAVWSTLLDALSLMLSRSQGEAIVLEILKGYQAFTQSCGVLRAIPPRDAFLASLCKFSLAPIGDTEKLSGSSNGPNASLSQGKRVSDSSADQREGAVLTVKNLQALRTLFNVSHRLNCVLDQSWVMVLETLAVVDRLIHSPHATTQEVSAFGARTSEGRQASDFQVLLILDSQLFESSAMMTTSAVCALIAALREVSLNSLAGVTSGLGTAASGSSVTVASTVGVAMLPKMFAVDRMLATLSNNLHRADLLWDQVSAHFLELTEHESPQVRAVALDALDRSIGAVLGCERIRRDAVKFKATSGEELGVAENAKEFGQFVTLGSASDTSKTERRSSVLKGRKGSFQLDAFECAVVLPLSSIYHRGQTAELRSGAVKILLHVLERHGEKLYHSWPSILELLKSVANDSEKDIVPLGFQNVRIIMNDGLLSIPSDALETCVQVAGAYGAQKTDMNISLTAIGLLWTVADFFARGVDHKGLEGDNSRHLGMKMELYRTPGSSGRLDSHADTGTELGPPVLVERTDMDWDGLLLAVYGVLQGLGTDERPEVRNSAIRTLFQSVSSHGLKISGAMWEHCLWKLIFPLVNTVRHLAATSSKDEIGKELGMQGGKRVHMLVHHSRNTAQKQWDETLVVVLGGFSRLFKPPYFHICQSINNFKQGWEVILSFIQESVLEGSKEVGLAALSSLHSILLMQASKGNLSSFFFNTAFAVYETIVLSISKADCSVPIKVSQELLQNVAELYSQGYAMFEQSTYLRLLAMVDVYVRHPSNLGESPAGGVLPPLQRTGMEVLPLLKPMDDKLMPLWPVLLRQILSYLPGGEGLIGDHCKNTMGSPQQGIGEEFSPRGMGPPQTIMNGHDQYPSPKTRASIIKEPYASQSDQLGSMDTDVIVLATTLDSSALSFAFSVKVLGVLLQLYEVAPTTAKAVVLPTLVASLGRCMATRRDSPTDLLWRAAVGNFNRVVEESLIPDSSDGFQYGRKDVENRGGINRPKFWKEVAEAYEKFLVGACGRAFTLPGGETVSADVIKADELLEASMLDVLSHKVLNCCQDAPREVVHRLIDVIDRCAARTSLLPLPSVSLLPVHCGRFSLLCLNKLFKLCWVAPELTNSSSKIAVSRMSVVVLTRRCSSILRQFQVDENDSGETPMPQVRVDELIFVLEELARLGLHPLTASALELPITRKERPAGQPVQPTHRGSIKDNNPAVWQYGHLLLLFTPLCELVGSRVTRVNELLHILLRIMGRELGL
ncbi:unnamed protein product [Calypogeia fissa]